MRTRQSHHKQSRRDREESSMCRKILLKRTKQPRLRDMIRTMEMKYQKVSKLIYIIHLFLHTVEEENKTYVMKTIGPCWWGGRKTPLHDYY